MRNLVGKISIACLLVCLCAASLLAQTKKVALVSFYSDKKIGGTGLGTAMESLINDPSFNLKPLVDKSYDRFVNEFAKDFPFTLIDNSEIVGNQEYKNYKSTFLVDTAKTANKLMGIQYVTAKDLIFAYGGVSLMSDDKKDQCNLAKIFSNADAVLFVSMDYEFEPRAMGFAVGITAYLNMFMYDKKCDKIFRIRELGKSKGKVAAVGGIPVMNPKEIQPLCEDATEALFAELQGKLGKIVKKSAKF